MHVILAIDPTPVGIAELPKPAEGIPSRIDSQAVVLLKTVEDHLVEQEALQIKRTFPVMQVIFLEEPEHLRSIRLEQESREERIRSFKMEQVKPSPSMNSPLPSPNLRKTPSPNLRKTIKADYTPQKLGAKRKHK